MTNFIPPDLWDFVGAVIVSFISGLVSITRRVAQGQPASILWVVSEFLTAIFCGYLMYSAYPYMADDVPKWFTPLVAVAVSAHFGGRLFQEVEANFSKYVSLTQRRK